MPQALNRVPDYACGTSPELVCSRCSAWWPNTPLWWAEGRPEPACSPCAERETRALAPVA